MRNSNLLVLAMACLIISSFVSCSSDKKSSPCLTCPGPNPAIAVARQFLADNQDRWPMRAGLDEWRFGSVQYGYGNDSQVLFYQYYRGRRVLDGFVAVRTFVASPASLAYSTFVENVSVSIKSVISYADGLHIAEADLNSEDNVHGAVYEDEPLVIEREGKFYLCWQVWLEDRYSGVWIYYIDAHGGDVVVKYNNGWI